MLQFTVIAHFSEHIYHERKDLYLLGFLFIYFLFVLFVLFVFIRKNIWSPRCAAHCGDNFVIENLGEIETEIKTTDVMIWMLPPVVLLDARAVTLHAEGQCGCINHREHQHVVEGES